MKHQIIRCTYDQHAQLILDIYNEVIATSTAMYDYESRTIESMKIWFESKEEQQFPVIGLESEDGRLIAVGSYGSFRTPPAYKYSVEHSIYIHQDFRGKGLGHI